MQQTPKEKSDIDKEPCETADANESGSYYYDDAHGYQDFDPNAADENDDIDEDDERRERS